MNVKHYEVSPAAFEAMVRVLRQLPYEQVAGVLQLVQQESKGIPADEPDTPEIDDENGGE